MSSEQDEEKVVRSGALVKDGFHRSHFLCDMALNSQSITKTTNNVKFTKLKLLVGLI